MWFSPSPRYFDLDGLHVDFNWWDHLYVHCIDIALKQYSLNNSVYEAKTQAESFDRTASTNNWYYLFGNFGSLKFILCNEFCVVICKATHKHNDHDCNKQIFSQIKKKWKINEKNKKKLIHTTELWTAIKCCSD